ncbi:S8 family serine peptidase [Halomarina oriensis]|uniref:S8 family serine peptidase n=1 Tax=Halomarina oriensis TaxID=671145 RepID=A0A6B0GND2_9EURY|nr:S8 family serine peptidase [Halomarina oriensis]MWG33088.1 S8 family serine peptidase [Halomarina oriensis]
MTDHSRRKFLKVSGAALGGAFAASSTVTAMESRERFIVKLRGNRSPNAEVLYDLSEIGYAVVKGSESALETDKAVKSHAPDISFDVSDPARKSVSTDALDESTDDSFYSYQWDKQDLDVPTAHETTTGEGSRVAVIDSGIDATHPDLAPNVNVDLSQDFTGDGLGAGVPGGGDHGTHVAGIVGASNAGDTGVIGTAPDTELVDYRVFSNFGGENGAFSIVVAAVLQAAADDCDVANLSLGAYPISRKGLGSFYGGFLNKAMTYANKEGTLLVISAGNDAVDLQHDNGQRVDVDGDGELETLEGGHWISLPNEGAQAMSVSATGPVGYGYSLFADQELVEPPETPAKYTNYGTNAVDIGAPGGNYDLSMTDPLGGVPAYAWDLVFNTVTTVLTDDEGNYAGSVPGWGWKAGTSMAAPNVAGAAALVKSVNPGYNANQLESTLKRAADVPEAYGKEYYGSGYLNVLDAL